MSSNCHYGRYIIVDEATTMPHHVKSTTIGYYGV